MKNFLALFFSILDREDRSQFKKYILVLFLGGILSIIGIGAFIPFMNILIQPEKIMHYSCFQGWRYQHLVIVLACILIAAFAIKNSSTFLLYRYQANFLYSLVAKIQNKLFTGYMSFNYEYHLKRSTPKLIKNINNETNMFTINIVAQFGTILTESSSSIFVLLFLMCLSPIFTLCILGSLICTMNIFMRIIQKKLTIHGNRRASAWEKMTENVLMGLCGIKEAKLYHCESHFIDKFSAQTDELKLATIYQTVYSQAPRLLIEFSGIAVVMILTCLFILLHHDPKEMLMIMGVFGVSAGQLLPSMNRIMQAVVQIRYAMPALVTISNELKLQEKIKFKILENYHNLSNFDFKQSIELKNIAYQYEDGTRALNDISLVIPKDKKVALVGVSGAGKTTLMDLIIGLYKAQNGAIWVDGKLLESQDDLLSFQEIFGYIPQHIQLFDKTIAENIAFGVDKNDIDMNLIWQCLEMAQLKSFVLNLKNKEHSFVGENGIRLSGGQRQRLGIARALYRKPKILVMDEATSALDNNTEKEITDVILHLKDITILTIAHRLTTIKHYDLIYLLNNGRIVSFGRYDELLGDCKLFQRMSRSLTEENTVDSCV